MLDIHLAGLDEGTYGSRVHPHTRRTSLEHNNSEKYVPPHSTGSMRVGPDASDEPHKEEDKEEN
ncbi:hypothetical protein E2C01_041377 [Portunus trituberculatus]|uniref:Uncharacterized protein n=1 Tax=Portunus trituberculatus TaxID=210409 RepID=A0A5B7FQL1_PORTR|nr:hypothetical protein [Portunus trituberculatus]